MYGTFSAVVIVNRGLIAIGPVLVGEGSYLAAMAGRVSSLTLDCLVNFFTVDGYVSGGADTEANFITTDTDDGNDNVIADHDSLVGLSGQHEHPCTPSLELAASRRKPHQGDSQGLPTISMIYIGSCGFQGEFLDR